MRSEGVGASGAVAECVEAQVGVRVCRRGGAIEFFPLFADDAGKTQRMENLGEPFRQGLFFPVQ